VVDPSTGNVFVGEDGTGLLVEFATVSTPVTTSVCNPTSPPQGTQILASLCVGNWPQSVFFDPTSQLLYVTIENSENFSVVNPVGLQPVAVVPTGNFARGLAVDPNNGRIFVSDGFGDDVTVIDSASDSVLTTFNLTGYTYLVGAQFDTTTGQLFFLANNNDDILSVNPTTYALEQSIQVQPNTGGGSGPIAGVDPQTHVMYYAARGSYEVDLIGELNGSVFGYFSTGSSYGPTNTFYDPSNNLLYVADGGWLYLGYGEQVTALNATTGAPVANMTVGGFPSAFAYDSARHLLYVSCAGTGVVSVINDTTNQVVATISLGSGTLPGDIAVDPSTGNLFVGEDGTGMLVELPPA
jgi:YVTN family beta-propeller protein